MRRWSGRVPDEVHARAGDVGAILLALLLGGLATDATDVATGDYAVVDTVVGLTAITTLWWRRRAPRVVAGITFVAAAAAPLAAGAAIVGVFTVVAHARPTRWTAAVPLLYVLYLVSGVVSLVAFPDRDGSTIESAVVGVVLTVAAVGWGLAVRARREAFAALAARADRAEADQHARVEEARRAERARIAAEMHDVLAHRLTMLSLAAGAIEHRPDGSAEELAGAAVVVRTSAHLALEDLRQVIGILREDEIATTAPLPAAGDLERLVEESRGAGMMVELAAPLGTLADMPPELARHTYRIVQEGLTNAQKHAPGQPVCLRVVRGSNEELEIEVTNPSVPGPAGLPGAGVGLVGMRERVELAGGTLDAGIDGQGTHVLRAHLPWPQA